jgi:hypothetical protein
MVVCPLVASPKVVTLDVGNRLAARVEHDPVMPLQRLAEPRKVDHDDASCHSRQSFTHALDQ